MAIIPLVSANLQVSTHNLVPNLHIQKQPETLLPTFTLPAASGL